jgi:hypothetical protein
MPNVRERDSSPFGEGSSPLAAKTHQEGYPGLNWHVTLEGLTIKLRCGNQLWGYPSGH